MTWLGWTPENDAELTRRFENGESFGQIGAAMGCTRSAAIGRAHRRGMMRGRPTNPFGTARPHRSNAELLARATAVKPTPKPKPTATSIRVSSNGRRAYPVSIGEVPKPSPRYDGPSVILMELGAHACKWPYGDGPFTFCGKRTAGDGPYCEDCIRTHKPYQRPTGWLSDARLLDSGRKRVRKTAPTFDDYERKAARA